MSHNTVWMAAVMRVIRRGQSLRKVIGGGGEGWAKSKTRKNNARENCAKNKSCMEILTKKFLQLEISPPPITFLIMVCPLGFVRINLKTQLFFPRRRLAWLLARVAHHFQKLTPAYLSASYAGYSGVALATVQTNRAFLVTVSERSPGFVVWTAEIEPVSESAG